MLRLPLLILLVALGLSRAGDAFIPDAGLVGPSRDGGLAALGPWSGPGDDLMTARVLLRESGAANLTLLAGAGDCATAPVETVGDPNPDQVFAAVFVACCRVCSAGKACGDTCIAANLTCHTSGGCACNAGTAPAPNPTVLTTPAPRAVISVVGQSPYPTIRVGQTAELLLTADITGGSWPDGTIEARVANTLEVGQGLRGWDTTGLIALNRAVTGSSTRQIFRGLLEGVKPGTYRVRVAFSDNNGPVPPDGTYWDISVVAASTPAPASTAPAATTTAPTPAATQPPVALPDPTSVPAAPTQVTTGSGGSGGGMALAIGAIAGIAGWVWYRRRRSDL